MLKISYSIEEAADVIGIGKTKTYELIKQRRLPTIKLDGRTLVLHADLEALLSRHRVT